MSFPDTPFVNIPPFPGVPAVPRDPAALNQLGEQLLTGDVFGVLLNIFAPLWGIFQSNSNTRVVTPDNVTEIDFNGEFDIPNFKIEEGQFASFNKVTLPFDVMIQMTKGGTYAERQKFLEDLDSIAPGTELYDVVTPEKTYSLVTVAHYDYRRTSIRGVALITANVYLQQISSQGVTSTYSTTSPPNANAQNPSAQGVTHNGNVQVDSDLKSLGISTTDVLNGIGGL